MELPKNLTLNGTGTFSVIDPAGFQQTIVEPPAAGRCILPLCLPTRSLTRALLSSALTCGYKSQVVAVAPSVPRVRVPRAVLARTSRPRASRSGASIPLQRTLLTSSTASKSSTVLRRSTTHRLPVRFCLRNCDWWMHSVTHAL